MMKHICMICRKAIDPNGADSMLKTKAIDGVIYTGFEHYKCQDTFSPEFIDEA